MKNFAAKAVVSAISVVWGTAAFAGFIAAPATTTKYAVESLVSTTDITLPTLIYRMGVARTGAQDFTVIITPSAGATFTTASCAAATPTISLNGTATGALIASLKRSSASECAYEVDVTTAFSSPVGANATVGGNSVDLVFPNLAYDTHGLATAGSTAGIVIALKDLGETAFIDNTGSLSVNTALSGNALTLVATQDVATVANVNDTAGPLFGFLANATVPADTATVAAASFVIRNNNDGTDWKKPDGTTSWNNVVDGTNIAVTIAGNFGQLAAAAGSFGAASSVGAALANPVVSGSTATFSVPPLNTGVAGTSTTITTTFTTARNASMGTARTFGVSAIGDVATGADVALAGNASWWLWSANASQLMTPYFTNDSRFISRFFLLNTGSGAVNYTADCFSETGNAITYGAARAGSLSANGVTALAAASICTFAGNSRGSIIFTINTPINTVKGTYQYIDPVSFNGIVTPLTRPYNQANTTE